MRSFLLVAATVVLIVCGFVLYSMLHETAAPRRAQQQKIIGPTSIPADGEGSTSKPVVGAGSGAWVRQFDEKTARLKSQFKADRYDPNADGTLVNVERPVAEFMLGDSNNLTSSGFIRIEGADGTVVMPAPPIPEDGGRGVKPAPPGPPSRGHLRNVLISLFDQPAADGQAQDPTLTVRMNNASFDNDTFLITTDPFDDPATGKHVDADQVPVTLRGRDYDFDGRGLRIQWNELNQRLQLLEIAHGESLTVKNRGKFDAMRGANKSPTTETTTSAPAPATASGARRKHPGATPAPAAATVPTTKPAVPYRASFEKDVRITEGDVELATAELMQVDFLLEPSDTATTQPAPDATPPTHKGAKHRPTTAPATEPASAIASAPDVAPAAQPTVQQLPIIVHWTGRLRVMPLEKSDEPTLAADDQILRLSGTPLTLHRNGSEIEAAGAVFRTADGSASLRSSDDVPRVTLRSADGALISTPALAYSEDGGVATLTGPSRADIPSGSGDQREMLSATWNDECHLTMQKDVGGESVIRTASLKGAVAIAHPRMELNSDALDLAFAAPEALAMKPAAAADDDDDATATKHGASPNLERMVATGSVLAKLKDAPDAPPRSVQAQRLEMQTQATSDGQLLPRKIIADNQVLMTELTQSLKAEHLEALLAPKPTTEPAAATTGPAPQAATDPTSAPTTSPTTRRAGDMPEMIVESLVAQGKVRLDGEKGAFATAEQLLAVDKDGQSEVKLLGVQSTPAVVSDGRNTITGGVLLFRPKDQKATVPGPGSLAFVPESKDGKTAQPVNVAWAGHAELDGHTNLVDLDEGVKFKTTDAEGMTTTSSANHLQIVLADKPTTQPATQPTSQPSTAPPAAQTTRPTTRRSTGGLGDLQNTNFMANKEPRSAKLSGEVTIDSTQLKDTGEILRRMYLESAEANYDLPTRKMVVPVPGRLLYEDHRPPEAQKDEDGGPGNRGTTAFAWHKSLTYDDAEQRVVMDGDVDINHVPDAQAGEAFRIATQRVTAELEPKPTTAPSTTQSTSQPTTRPGPMQTAMRLKRVIADGGVNVKTRRFQFTARHLTYSPATAILTASSAPGEPITLTDEQGQVNSAIDSLTWNTRTDQISLKGGRGRLRP